MLRKSCLFIAGFISLYWGCQRDDLEKRISRVEIGLIRAVIIKGEPVEKMGISNRMVYFNVPGVSIAKVSNYKLDWARAYGIVEANEKVPVTTSTLFQAAALSKPITVMAVLRKAQERGFSIDDPVNDYLISWKIPDNRFTRQKSVTVRGLLSHSSGITAGGFRGYAQDEPVPTLSHILDGLQPANSRPIRVNISPESRFVYSGGGYCVIQQLLVDLENMPFQEIMSETILKPLEMHRSTFEQPLPDSLKPHAATGHRRNGKPLYGKWHTYPEMAAAGLWTTPSELARFMIEVMRCCSGMSERIISNDMVQEMVTSQKGGYGFGLNIRGNGEDLRISHSGGNEGYYCYMVAYPDKGEGAVVMTNGDGGWWLLLEIIRSIAVEYKWDDFHEKVKKRSELDSTPYDLYAGEYCFSPEYCVQVTTENDHLFVEFPGESREECLAEAEHTFFFINKNIQLTFILDDNGSVSAMIESVYGQKLRAEKVFGLQ